MISDVHVFWNTIKRAGCALPSATLDSAVTLGLHGAKNFLMRDGKEVVLCVFYENVSWETSFFLISKWKEFVNVHLLTLTCPKPPQLKSYKVTAFTERDFVLTTFGVSAGIWFNRQPPLLSNRNRNCRVSSVVRFTAAWGTTTAAETSWCACPSDPACPQSWETLRRPSKPATQKWERWWKHSVKSEHEYCRCLQLVYQCLMRVHCIDR